MRLNPKKVKSARRNWEARIERRKNPTDIWKKIEELIAFFENKEECSDVRCVWVRRGKHGMRKVLTILFTITHIDRQNKRHEIQRNLPVYETVNNRSNYA